MFELSLKIVLCHLIGDFVLQTDKMVESIRVKKFKSSYLYVHVFIHLILMLMVIRLDSRYIFGVFILALSHLIIDSFTKIILARKIKGISNLILDQALHFLTIFLFIVFQFDINIHLGVLVSPPSYLSLIVLIGLTNMTSIIIGKTMEWFDYIPPNGGLEKAGKVIGILERLLVFYFVISSFWEGIGFLLAAKSIFRFGELKDSKDVKHTEYILIGTLLSFSMAILIALIYLRISSLLI